jgi:acetyl esterase/lipase
MAGYEHGNSFEVEVRDIGFPRVADGEGLARIYRPLGGGPFPAILYVHGGAWSSGDRTTGAALNQQLAASGALIVAIDLRLGPEDPYPSQVADVNFATRWLKLNAAKLNADARCLGIIGSSSGGHTAVLSAMRPDDPRYCSLRLPEADTLDATASWVIALWPVLDPYARYLYAQEAGREELVRHTTGYFITEEAMREGNPQLLLVRKEKAKQPPILIIQGTADTNVPLSIPERFARSYRAAGGEVDLELFPGMPHGFADGQGAESDRAVKIMKAWMARQLADGH